VDSLSSKIGVALTLYGGWGLLLISFLDSSFLSLPLANDLFLIHLAGEQPHKMLLFATQCTLGSVLGAYVTYAIARGGGKFLLRKASEEKVARTRRWLDRNDFVTVLVASLLPPPAPFKLFLITAGIVRVNAGRFGLALLVGRGARFLMVGWLGAMYGAAAEAYLRKNLAWVSLVTIAVVLGLTFLYRRVNARRSAATPIA
jgi:membrane protein YqaA with SNARE-associated domain